MLKYTSSSRSCTTRSSDGHRDIVFRSCQSVIRPCSKLNKCTCTLDILLTIKTKLSPCIR